MFLGVGVFAAGYFFGYRPQMEEAQSIQASTEPLKTRLDDLLKLAADRNFYLKETEDINAKVSEYTSAFPADIRPEDGIVLSMNMENSLDMQISNVGLGTREFVASLDGSTEDPLADLPDQTLSEQANDQTQSQLDEIEGTDVIGEKERQAASDAEVENLNNVFTSPVLYRTQDTMQFTGTYASLKDMVDYLDGKDFWEINKAAYHATVAAHSKKLPCLTIEVDELDAYHFGQLFYFFQFACYLSCKIMGVNPFDQPGVEAYKKWMFEALGK